MCCLMMSGNLCYLRTVKYNASPELLVGYAATYRKSPDLRMHFKTAASTTV
jgi:hypothetical protein